MVTTNVHIGNYGTKDDESESLGHCPTSPTSPATVSDPTSPHKVESSEFDFSNNV